MQVEGVDEADVVKSDGNFVCAAPPPRAAAAARAVKLVLLRGRRRVRPVRGGLRGGHRLPDCGDCADGVWGAGYNDQLSVLTIVKAWPAAAASAVATVELSAVYNVEGSDLMLDGDSLLVVGSAWYPEGGWRTEEGADGAALPTVALLT